MKLSRATFVVVDTETTGLSADRDRLTEVAAVRIRDGEIVDRWSQLINPGRTIPRRITEITGISMAMVFDQPPAAEVLPELLAFLGDDVLVAHNITFDQRFLDAELSRAGLPRLRNPKLCTVRLARRLLPGLSSKSLGSVAAHYGIPIRGRHRALGDAEATARVLLRFLPQLGFSHGVETLDELLRFQNRRYTGGGKEPRYRTRIREEVLPRLPHAPGVYFMKDAHGATIYVGKAKRLSHRVRSYFSGVEGKDGRLRKLVTAIRDVEWEETGSELEALLLESRLIKQLQPRFNRAQRRYRNRPFIRLDPSEPFPRIGWTSYIEDDGAEYFGPVRGRRTAELVVELVNRFYLLRECDDDTFARGHTCLYHAMGRCGGPCADDDARAGYPAEVERVRTFLRGGDRDVPRRIEAAMREAAAKLDFEAAGEYRDWLAALDRLLGHQEQVASPVLDHHAVVVLPSIRASRVTLLFVRFGRHVGTLSLSRQPSASERAMLHGQLEQHFRADDPRPARYLKQEVDEVRILANWLYAERENVEQVLWTPGTTHDAFAADVLAAVDRVVEAPGAAPAGATDVVATPPAT